MSSLSLTLYFDGIDAVSLTLYFLLTLVATSSPASSSFHSFIYCSFNYQYLLFWILVFFFLFSFFGGLYRWLISNYIIKMSSLRNAISRRAHKERVQPWVILFSPLLTCWNSFLLFHIWVYDFFILFYFIFSGKQGKNLGFLKNIRTMLSVQKHTTKRRRLYG